MIRTRIISALGIISASLLILASLFIIINIFPAFKTLLDSFRDTMFTMGEILAILIAIIFITLVLLAIYAWMDEVEGITILPFANTTGNVDYDGKAISDSIVMELSRINHIYKKGIKSNSSILIPKNRSTEEAKDSKGADIYLRTFEIKGINQSLASETEYMKNFISQINIGVGGASLPIGQLLVLIRRKWPITESGGTISGSVQKFGSTFRLLAYLERDEISVWKVDRTVEDIKDVPNDLMPDLIEELAYKIVYDLSREKTNRYGDLAKTKKGFTYFTEALYSYDRYVDTGQTYDLITSGKNAIECMLIEPNYLNLSYLFYSLGIAHINIQNNIEAEKMFRYAVELIPEAPPEYNGISYDVLAYNGLGQSLLNLGQYDKAESAFEKAKELDPDAAFSWTGLGAVFLATGRNEEARSSFKKATDINPNEASPWISLGSSNEHLGEIQEAEAAFKQAIKIDPKDVRAWIGLGWFYMRLGRNADAEEAFRKATEVNTRSSWAWTNLGTYYNGLNRNEDAEAAFKKATEVNPKDSWAWNNLFSFYKEMGRSDDAEAAFNYQ